jgi:hypothetical protein
VGLSAAGALTGGIFNARSAGEGTGGTFVLQREISARDRRSAGCLSGIVITAIQALADRFGLFAIIACDVDCVLTPQLPVADSE